jgi:hypothetical protein
VLLCDLPDNEAGGTLPIRPDSDRFLEIAQHLESGSFLPGLTGLLHNCELSPMVKHDVDRSLSDVMSILTLRKIVPEPVDIGIRLTHVR